jgi:ATP-binding cassette, subfamily B, bacterial
LLREEDGIDLRQFDPVAIRPGVSVILQNYARYCLTARENIWLRDIILPAHGQKIFHAALQTRADDFILKLPRGGKYAQLFEMQASSYR